MEKHEGYIRCSNCGNTYRVVGDNLYDEDITFHCECGSDIDVAFFVHCKHCDEIVGLDNGTIGEALMGIAGSAIGGAINAYFRPASFISNFERFIDNIPSAKGWGVCKFCNTKYIRCPRCYEPVEVKPGTGDNDILFCVECGQKMRQP